MDGISVIFTIGAIIGTFILIFQHTPAGKRWMDGE